MRESILNAIAHRDYRLHGSVFVRQYPRRIRIESPGGFLPGITPETIMESKSRPRFDGTDDYQVYLTLEGQVQDIRFLGLLEAIGQEQVRSFDTDHLLLLDMAYRQQAIPTFLRPRVHELVEAGILEQMGRKVIPSRRLMALLGEKGRYTRLKGLDRPAQRELLLQHIRESKEGARFEDLEQVLPGPASNPEELNN